MATSSILFAYGASAGDSELPHGALIPMPDLGSGLSVRVRWPVRSHGMA